MKKRNLLLVVLWSYGLFILIHMYQYVGALLAAWISGQGFDAIMSGNYESSQTDFIISLTALIIGVPLIFLVIKFLWRRNFEWMRLQFNYKKLILGLTLGLLLPLVILQVLNLMGCANISWSSIGLQSEELIIILGYGCVAIFTGIVEEVVFRGMVVREFAQKYGWVIAAVIGGVLFGLPHLITMLQDISLINMLQILLASIIVSFLFVAMYIRTHSLWFPIGFHIAWNFCLKGILGVTMSGSDAKAGFLNIELTGSPLLTGGSFGIEASFVSILVYFILAFMFFKLPLFGEVDLLSNKYKY